MPQIPKLTILLIKDSVRHPDDIFKDPDQLKVEGNDGPLLYYAISQPRTPDWAHFVSSNFDVKVSTFQNFDARAVLVLDIFDRLFAITFGAGYHLINQAAIEYNFGLKVAINTIPKGDLRQMDLTTPEFTSQKTRKQAVKNQTPEEFGINKRKDILRGVVGQLPDGCGLGKRAEGKDSIKITRKVINVDEIPDICETLLGYYSSDKYKEEYSWIDNIAFISDKELSDDLFLSLIEAIKRGDFEDMHIAQPDFVGDLHSYSGFIFSGNGKKKKTKIPQPFPGMGDLVEDLGHDFIEVMDVDKLKKTCRVWLRTEDGEDHFGWPLSRCIAWETERDGQKYILSEGEWYRVDQNF